MVRLYKWFRKMIGFPVITPPVPRTFLVKGCIAQEMITLIGQYQVSIRVDTMNTPLAQYNVWKAIALEFPETTKGDWKWDIIGAMNVRITEVL